MLNSQTVKPDEIVWANWKPESNECDITKRYRIAYHLFDGMEYDCILFMENDDYYAPNYIETMIKEWVNNGKPDLFGIGYTYYYHLGIKKYSKFEHNRRASMMNTLIKPDLQFAWCKDSDPYTGVHLWDHIKNTIPNWKTFCPEILISIGIKHGIGMSGGQFHRIKLDRYQESDENFEFLKSHVTGEMFNFYSEMSSKAFKL